MGKLKKIFTALLLFLGLLGFSKTYAQQSNDVSEYNVIKWDPFSMGQGTLTFAYERIMNNHISLEGTLNITAASATVKNSKSTIKGKENLAVFGFVPELRYYPLYKKHSAPRGVFVGPFLRYQAGSANGQDSAGNSSKISGSRFSIGGEIGYQFIFSHAISLEAFIGPCYDNIAITASTSNPMVNAFNINIGSAGVSTIDLRYGLTVGIAF